MLQRLSVNTMQNFNLNVLLFIAISSASFMTKTVPCGNELHKFLIWDTAGQERVSIIVVSLKAFTYIIHSFSLNSWEDDFLE